MSDSPDFTIDRLGEMQVKSPMHLSTDLGDNVPDFVADTKRVIYQVETDADTSVDPDSFSLMELAGPRPNIFFDPKNVHAAIITCGGLCPGLNDVIRSVVLCLWHHYGVQKISGIQFGYRGLLKEFDLDPLPLDPKAVRNIHREGGTLLGSSRGFGDRTEDMADTLQQMGVNMLFTIGGDGTQRAALDLAEALKKRNAPIVVVGIPKTIDNDLSFVERSFGFETAVAVADDVVAGAHVEATGAPGGIAVVKVMGRQSGFIAAATALANNDVNYVLVPEVPFALKGPNGLFQQLESRLAKRGHAVIVVAEGAGQELLPQMDGTDASGNARLSDIGLFLSDQIKIHFKSINVEATIKYIDPSYIIRSTPANANDSIYCARLGTNAAHAAMSGKTGLLISLLNSRLVHVPIKLATQQRNTIDPDGSLWRAVSEATGQPLMTGE